MTDQKRREAGNTLAKLFEMLCTLRFKPSSNVQVECKFQAGEQHQGNRFILSFTLTHETKCIHENTLFRVLTRDGVQSICKVLGYDVLQGDITIHSQGEQHISFSLNAAITERIQRHFESFVN